MAADRPKLKRKFTLGIKERVANIEANSEEVQLDGNDDSWGRVRSLGSETSLTKVYTAERKLRDRLKPVISSPRFNLFIGSLICFNTVLMGLELDQDPVAAPSTVMLDLSGPRGLPQHFFDIFEVFFLTIFGIEFGTRVYVHGRQLLYELATYIDFMALSPAVLLMGFDVESSKQLTLLRVVRLVKLCRLLRLFKLSKELNMLAQSMSSAFSALIWIGVLLFITMYCSAVVCTMVIGQSAHFSSTDATVVTYQAEFGDNVYVKRYWGSLMRSMLTLFQIFTLDDWNQIVRPIVETHQPFMLFFFVGFVFITTFGLLNLLMGTIVDKAMQVAKEQETEKEKLCQNEEKQMMLATVRLFSLADFDGDGLLSSQELKRFLSECDLKEVLEKEMAAFKIKLDYEALSDICEKIASEWCDNATNEDAGITVEEFAGAASRLHGTAKSRDMLSVLITAKATLARVCDVEEGIARLQEAAKRHEAKLDMLLFGRHRGTEFYSTEGSNDTDLQRDDAQVPVSYDSLVVQSSESQKSMTLVVPFTSPPALGASPRASPRSSIVWQGDPRRSIRAKTHTGMTGPADSADEGTSPSVYTERSEFKNEGAKKISSLLREFKDYNDFQRTETATAMQDYSTRFGSNSSKAGAKAPRRNSIDGDQENKNSRRPSIAEDGNDRLSDEEFDAPVLHASSSTATSRGSSGWRASRRKKTGDKLPTNYSMSSASSIGNDVGAIPGFVECTGVLPFGSSIGSSGSSGN